MQVNASLSATSAPQRGLPTALIVGPQKAGTSWIHEYLQARGDVCLPRGVKETFFFDERFDRKGIEWYRAHFAPARQHRQTVEVAPTYFHSSEATRRILEGLGRVPIVITLRDPVRRAYSLYLHLKRYGFTDLPLREAVIQRPEIVESSRYAHHVERWLESFGRSRVHVLFQEELAQSPTSFAAEIDRCLELGVPAKPIDLSRKVNEATTSRWPVLAGRLRIAGDWLRDRKLYWPIELAKQLGAKGWVYGNGKPPDRMTDEDREWLEERLDVEADRLKSLLNIEQLPWESSTEISH